MHRWIFPSWSDRAVPCAHFLCRRSYRHRRTMRRIFSILISMLLHGYVGLRLVPPLAGWPAAGSALGVLLAASALLLPRQWARH